MQIIHANWAILLEFLGDAYMVVFLGETEATAADVTMEKVFSSSYSANSASIAMENLFFFVFIVEKIANTAEISCKLDLTIITIFFWCLDMFAILAANLHYFVTVYLVIFFGVHFIFKFFNVMAKPAIEKFLALRTSFVTLSLVMLASINLAFSFFFFFLLKNIISLT